MKKIRLDVDHLAVESFATGQLAEEAKGTVHGAFAITSTGNCATCKGATCYTSCAFEGGDACTCPI
jgi:hypothetical protein